MSNRDDKNKQFYLGIDGGGTKCKAVIYSSQFGVISQGLSGPANVSKQTELAIEHILEASSSALDAAKIDGLCLADLIAGIGLAGLNLPDSQLKMEGWQHPFKQAFFTSDLHAACIGAHQGQDGAVIIAGTGSSGLVLRQGQLTELGGHGFPCGDCGSGAWLGLKAIELTLKALDGLHQSSGLSSMITAHYQVTDAKSLAQHVASFKPADYARIAPLVIQQAQRQEQDAVAIVKVGVNYLSNMALALTAQTPLPLSLIGGLTPYLTEYFPESVQTLIKPAAQPPEVGAILYAQAQSKRITNQESTLCLQKQ